MNKVGQEAKKYTKPFQIGARSVAFTAFLAGAEYGEKEQKARIDELKRCVNDFQVTSRRERKYADDLFIVNEHLEQIIAEQRKKIKKTADELLKHRNCKTYHSIEGKEATCLDMIILECFPEIANKLRDAK